MLTVSGKNITDQHGRAVILKGCSVAGNCKYPSRPESLPTHSPNLEAFYNHRAISFLDRPFPLKDAPSHFERLAGWGMNTIRLIVTWEALEHAGPGEYDIKYLDYMKQLVDLMPQYGINCIIDCHQDLFSRLCGGDGAPGWTLELAGFSVRDLNATLAAHIHAENLSTSDPPPSVWPSGYQKLATASMFTLFFGGDDWASQLSVPVVEHAAAATVFPDAAPEATVGIGTFLRKSYYAAFKQLAIRLKSCDALIGFEPMNEPHHGYLNLFSFSEWNPMTDLAWCYFPSAIEGMALGAGYAQDIGYYVRSFPHPTRLSHRQRVTPPRPAWQEGKGCIWRQHGVWDWDDDAQRPIVLRKSYFEVNPRTQQPVDFYQDCWFPFIKHFAQAVQSVNETWLIFAGGVPNEFAPAWPVNMRPLNLVYAPHFYDLHTLFSKVFGNWTVNVQALSRGAFPLNGIHLGRKGVNKNYARQTSNLTHPDLPSYFSEIGTSFEANLLPHHDARDPEKRRHPHLHWLNRQIDALLNAMDKLGCGYAYWLYNHDNDAPTTTQLGDYGDGWAGEDFSFVFKEHETSEKLGTRCLDALVRPSPRFIAGRDATWSWDMYSLDFQLKFKRADTVTLSETVVFLPACLYGRTDLWRTQLSDGELDYNSRTQLLTWKHQSSMTLTEQTLRLSLKGSPEKQLRMAQKRPDVDLPMIFWLVIVGVVVLPVVASVSLAR